MPVTARLSQRFYERFGDEITNELVEWFNSVDATYRSDLRELNELNFGRFDAKLERRLAELTAQLRGDMAGRFAEVDVRFALSESRIERRFAESEAKVLRRTFAFWTGTMLALAGFLYVMLHAR